MSKSQILRALMAAAAEDMSALHDRMITKYEEELRRSEEENESKQQLPDQVLNPRVLLHRAAPCPGLNHDFTETPPIKAEPEEQSCTKEKLPELVPESSAVCVKREKSSLPQNGQFEQRKETEVKDDSSEPLHLHCEGLTEHSDDTDNDDDWRRPLNFSDTEMEAEADGDPYDQVQVGNRSTKPSSQSKSAPETTATVHKRDKTRPDGTERKKHQCSVCAKTFKTKQELEVHTRIHTGEKPFRCSVCKKTFSHNGNLEKHRRTHTGDKPFKCSVCKKTFSHKGNLEKHRRTHTGDKPFRCAVCKTTFSQKGHLERHRRTHTGDKPFRCSVCTKTFSDKGNLETHRKIHTGDKPFRCAVCETTFSQKGNLERHRRTHTGEKPHCCETCEKTFTTKQNLKYHMSTHNI